ncbi:hypothetical protein [Campylobacter troglodytis]|uniref:hypothetical protein n=1 Tax=Campylobacter troglodytis TaxID=654363 RepID=UPI001159A088|nr:hypothetical protein [Campylobacter troglodytis]TQR57742.1 hypothetical protein DMC01_08320 [Campylobacter troglodytis]
MKNFNFTACEKNLSTPFYSLKSTKNLKFTAQSTPIQALFAKKIKLTRTSNSKQILDLNLQGA